LTASSNDRGVGRRAALGLRFEPLRPLEPARQFEKLFTGHGRRRQVGDVCQGLLIQYWAQVRNARVGKPVRCKSRIQSSSGRAPVAGIWQRSHLFSTNANARIFFLFKKRSQPSWRGTFLASDVKTHRQPGRMRKSFSRLARSLLSISGYQQDFNGASGRVMAGELAELQAGSRRLASMASCNRRQDASRGRAQEALASALRRERDARRFADAGAAHQRRRATLIDLSSAWRDRSSAKPVVCFEKRRGRIGMPGRQHERRPFSVPLGGRQRA